MSIYKLLNRLNVYFTKPIQEWIYNRAEYRYLKELINSINQKEILNKNIVFNTLRAIRNNIDIEVFIGLIFALHGAKVKILLDDGIMMHWDTLQFDNWNTLQFYKLTPNINQIDKYNLNPYNFNFRKFLSLKNHFLEVLFRRNIIRKAIKTYDVKNLDFIFYSEILNKTNVNYENLAELEKHAESSTIRFFRNSDLNYNNKYVKYYYNLSLKNAVLSRNVGEFVLKEIKPDLYITSHGMYSTHGPAFEYLKRNGIMCLLYISVTYKKKSYFKFIDTLEQTLSRSNSWKNYQNKIVNKEMIEKVDQYFHERFHGSAIDINIYSYMQNDRKLEINKENNYKYYICLFPNTIWDGNIKDRHIAFKDMLDWILTTIEFVKKRNDIKLYIKAHPGEMVFSRNTPKILELVNTYIDISKIENVVPIHPHQKINTYQFLNSGIDVGIVYDGFLGIEMPYLGIPTITCAEGGLSSIKGANITVKNKLEYLNYLENIDDVVKKFYDNREEIRKNVIRYVYWYLFEDLLIVPSFAMKKIYKFDLMALKKRDLFLNNKLEKLFK